MPELSHSFSTTNKAAPFKMQYPIMIAGSTCACFIILGSRDILPFALEVQFNRFLVTITQNVFVIC